VATETPPRPTRITAPQLINCLIQLRSGLFERGDPTRVKHIVELLDEATAL
jgi:Fe-S oxidoreductase